ncbi:MAG: AMP-binding protein [Cyclobacteriaceae bacterium]
MKDFVELLKEVAKRYHDRIAVIDGDRKLNYHDFILLVNSFSHQVKPKSKVVVDLDQGIEAYALIIAILNMGGTYCPLSPAAPLERKLQIISEFSPNLIVVSTEDKLLDLNEIEAITIKDLISNPETKDISAPYDEEDIIYIIYTSGSTGVPKGAKICRKALNKFLEWSIPTYGANEDDVWGQFSFLSFDLSIVDIFTCLCSGATLYSMNNLSAKKFRPAGEIEAQKITIWHSIPSAVEFMIKNFHSKTYDFTSLRLMSFCGEPLRKHQVEFLLSKNNSLKIFNCYGPTEGTLFCTWQELNINNYKNYSNYSMCIGKAIPGWNLQLSPVDEFEEKEITIYGDYIAKGYLGNVTDNKFKVITMDNKSIESFETGDLVNEVNGNLYFSCRKDRQVKLKGYRVELDEIDFRINEFLELTSVTLVDNQILYSFIETNGAINDMEIREHLKTVLEDYKIPHGFYVIEEIPRNSNQKIDMDILKNMIK